LRKGLVIQVDQELVMYLELALNSQSSYLSFLGVRSTCALPCPDMTSFHMIFFFIILLFYRQETWVSTGSITCIPIISYR
jgi:hypothetical protein